MVERTKMVHTVVGIITDVEQRTEGGNDTLAATPFVVGYFDLTPALSAKFGRNMMQAQVYRVRSVRINFTQTPGSRLEEGMVLHGDLRWFNPTAQRVTAHRNYAARWRTQAAMSMVTAPQVEPARGRQFIVKYETVQVSPPYATIMEDDSSATDVVPALIGTTAAGTGVSIFDSYGDTYPAYPAATDGQDQRLYTRWASESEDVLPWAISVGAAGGAPGGASDEEPGWNPAFGMYNVELPDGMAMEWMCGLARVQLHYTTPNRGADTNQFIRLSFIAIVEGWRPLR